MPDNFIHFKDQPVAPPDRDHDGVPDASDRCPDVFGANGSFAGCPIDLARNGGFNQDAAYWSTFGAGTNLTTYASNTHGTAAYEGARYMATNVPSTGGSIHQDVPMTINPGDTVCASAEVVTDGAATGAGGSLTLWMLDNSANENSAKTFSNLRGRNNWTPVSTCTTATGSHDKIRIEIYPTPNAPTLAVDAVDLRVSPTFYDASSLGISAPAKVKADAKLTVSTRLQDAATGQPLTTNAVALFKRTGTTAAWAKVCTRITSSLGRASATLIERRKTQYQWRFSGNLAHQPASASRWVLIG